MSFLSRQRLGRRHRSLVPFCDDGESVHRVRALEDAGQRVVIRRRDRVELVVVAAGTAQRQAEERSADRVNLLVDNVHLHFDRVVFGEHFRADRQEPRRGHPRKFRLGSLAGMLNQIAGELFSKELVERFVRVERCDHVVAIPKRVGVSEVFIEAV